MDRDPRGTSGDSTVCRPDTDLRSRHPRRPHRRRHGRAVVPRDVAVTEGRDRRIGRIAAESEGRRAIDATDLVVAPGFIDMMGQTARRSSTIPTAAFNLLTQGITTINAGEGDSTRRSLATPRAKPDGRPCASSSPGSTGRHAAQRGADRRPHAGAPARDRRRDRQADARRTGPHARLRARGDGSRRDRTLDLADLPARHLRVRRRRSPSWPRSPASTAAATSPTCATRATGCSRRSTRRCASAPRPVRRCTSSTSRPPGRPTGARWIRRSPASRRARAAGQQVGVDIYPYINNGLGIRALLHPRHAADGQDALLRQARRPGDPRARCGRKWRSLAGWENWFAPRRPRLGPYRRRRARSTPYARLRRA